MLRHIVAIVVLTIAVTHSEYVWTGTEWKWQEPGNTETKLPDTNIGSSGGFGDSSNVAEGSGGGDNWDDDYEDEDDYEDYTYDDYDKPKKDKKKNKNKNQGFGGNDDWGKSEKKNKKKNKNKDVNSGILPATDDEDFVEGSGSNGFEIPKAQDPNPWDNNFNNNNFNNNNNNWNNPVATPDNNNWDSNQNNQNVYDVDEDYDDDYDYDKYDDDISFTGPGVGIDTGNNWGNVQVDTTPRPNNPIINLDNVNNNIWNTPSTTERTYTPRSTTTTTHRPEIVTSSGSGPHRTVPVNRPASFFAQPGILAAVIGGAVVGLLCAILLVMFIVYRMRKKDEGSYALDEPKRSHNVNSYSKNPSREFYA